MDRFMAFPTHHERFASSSYHLFDPFRSLFSSWLLEINELANMVDLYFFFRSAEFTFVSKDSLKQFAPISHRELRLTINKDCVLLPFQRDTTELCHEWLLAAASLNHYLEAPSWAIGRLRRSFILACHCCNRGFMLPCQCFEQ